jgi:hypothetical protein
MCNKTLALALPLATLFLASGVASAPSFTVLPSFGGPEREKAAASLVPGTDGSFYGVAPCLELDSKMKHGAARTRWAARELRPRSPR